MDLFTPEPVDITRPTVETMHLVHGYNFKIIEQISRLPRVVTLQNEFMTFNAYLSSYVKTESECAVILDVVKMRLGLQSTGAAIITVGAKPYLIHLWTPHDIKVNRRSIHSSDVEMYDSLICLRHRFNASPTVGLMFKRHDKIISIESRCCIDAEHSTPTSIDYKTIIKVHRNVEGLMEHAKSIALIDMTIRRLYTSKTYAIDDYHISRFRSLT